MNKVCAKIRLTFTKYKSVPKNKSLSVVKATLPQNGKNFEISFVQRANIWMQHVLLWHQTDGVSCPGHANSLWHFPNPLDWRRLCLWPWKLWRRVSTMGAGQRGWAEGTALAFSSGQQWRWHTNLQLRATNSEVLSIWYFKLRKNNWWVLRKTHQ